jgi:hypothetical protein
LSEQSSPGGTLPMVTYLAQCANLMVFPICWHDPTVPPPKYCKAASCFALRFPERWIGVTAAHVVEEYLTARLQIPALTCQLRNLCDFDLEGALIDSDKEIDLATFSLTAELVGEIGSPAFDCQNVWPHPEPKVGYPVAFSGFAEYLFRPDENFRVNRDCVAGGVSLIQGVSQREIRLVYEPRDAKAVGDIPMIPRGASFSGCSGAPLVMPVLQPREGKLHPKITVIGAIIESTNQEKSEGEAAEYVSIVARRIECIQPDGKLVRPNSDQWLPPLPT